MILIWGKSFRTILPHSRKKIYIYVYIRYIYIYIYLFIINRHTFILFENKCGVHKKKSMSGLWIIENDELNIYVFMEKSD